MSKYLPILSKFDERIEIFLNTGLFSRPFKNKFRLQLNGTEYFCSWSYSMKEHYWWTGKGCHLGPIEQYDVTFEEVLDNVPAHVQTELLFHLDLFA